jgi:tRNA(Arg) A34 adenosine deaminase TadA
MDIEKELMYKACSLASISIQEGGGPFGCVITDANYNIIAEDHNRVAPTNDPTAHAEVVTIRKACNLLNTYDLSNCKLFTSCEPCPMCLSAIYWARIKDVYYSNTRKDAKNTGFDDDYIYKEISKNIQDRNISMKKIQCSNSSDSFTKWLELEDKMHY